MKYIIPAAAKKRKPTAGQKRAAAEHKGWFAAPDKLSDFQARAFDILGMVGGGIYNAPISWNTLDWGWSGICLSWRDELSTWDFMGLTRFVFLCHVARIRGSISPGARGCLTIIMHQHVDHGGVWRRHPNLTEAVAEFREYLPPDHRIAFRKIITIDPPVEWCA